MPGNPVAMPKLTNCIPNPNTWQGTETEKVQDRDPGKAADAALSQARAAANKLILAFTAQDCPKTKQNDCEWKDHPPGVLTNGPINIVPEQKPDAAHKGQVGLFWEATATVTWSISVFCFGSK